jgi:hypothetical protein
MGIKLAQGRAVVFWRNISGGELVRGVPEGALNNAHQFATTFTCSDDAAACTHIA